jgi:hypothetical protein
MLTVNMIPPIARNTIIFTGSLFIYGVWDFIRLMKSYKKKKS